MTKTVSRIFSDSELSSTLKIMDLQLVVLWMRFLDNLDFLWCSKCPFLFSDPYKTPEMNELEIGLSKKSKIIKIGSVEKKLQLFKVRETKS